MLEEIRDLKPQVEVTQEKEIKQEFKFLGSARRKKGQNLYSWNPLTGEVVQVNLTRRIAFDISKKQEQGNFKIVINPNHPLLWALNQKNAEKKFRKMLAHLKIKA